MNRYRKQLQVIREQMDVAGFGPQITVCQLLFQRQNTKTRIYVHYKYEGSKACILKLIILLPLERNNIRNNTYFLGVHPSHYIN